MVLKQHVTKCTCGRPIEFPEAQVRHTCKCNAVWECGVEGYWYSQSNVVPILPNLNPQSRPNRYERYMKRRGSGKKR